MAWRMSVCEADHQVRPPGSAAPAAPIEGPSDRSGRRPTNLSCAARCCRVHIQNHRLGCPRTVNQAGIATHAPFGSGSKSLTEKPMGGQGA